MAEKLNGQCMCGAVTLSIVPAEDEVHACHCEMCRRWTGSAFLAIGCAPADLEIAGPVKTIVSSDWAERAWCDACGSTLYYKVTLPGHERYTVAAGLFDAGGGLPLTEEIYIDRKPAGYAFAGDHARKTKAEIEAMFAAFGDGA